MLFVTHGEEDFDERFGFYAKGEFRCRNPFELPLAVISAIMLIPGGIALAIYFILIVASGNYIELGSFITPLVVEVIWLFFWATMYSFAHVGLTYRYTADEKEFHIFEPNSREEVFYYSDVVAVEYKPTRYITGRQHGWRVTIKTRYQRPKTYVLIYEQNRTKRETKDTPFNIIEQRMISTEKGEENG